MRSRPLIAFAVTALMLLAACATAPADEPITGYAPTSDGGRIEYVVTGPTDGEPVLLIHGGGLGTALMLVQQEPALADYRTIRMHRRGYVGSSEFAADTRSMPAEAADAAGVLDAFGVARVHVVGHSFGGAVALQLAAAAPERVASLALLDPVPPPGLMPPGPTSPAAGAAPPAPPLAALRMRAKERLDAGDREGALEALFGFVLGADWREDFNAVPGGLEQAIADADAEFGPDLAPWAFSAEQIAAIEQPALVLRGGDSRLWPEPVAAAFAEMLQEGEANAIPGTDHSLIQQKPDEVAVAIADFLARYPM